MTLNADWFCWRMTEMQGPQNYHQMSTERMTDPRRILTTSHIGSRGAFANFRFWIRFFDGLFVDSKTSRFRARPRFDSFCNLPASRDLAFIRDIVFHNNLRNGSKNSTIGTSTQGYTRTYLDKTPCKIRAMKLLRPLASYTLYDHTTNDSVRHELQTECILDKIEKYRRSWLLHL